MRNISAWSIRNPVPAIVLFVALTILGIVSFIRMDLNQDPDVSFPAATIVVTQPGAAPTELETQVTQRVEAAVRSISGVDEISSLVNEGSSSTTVMFTIGTPIDRAVNDMRDAISQIRSQLPDGILEPQVKRIDITGDPIMFASVEASDMTLEQLSWYVDNTVSKRLLGISGMAQVQREGGVSREIRVVLDPNKMQAQGITAAGVNAQLRQMNLNAAGGRAEIAGAEQSVRIVGNAADAYALGEKQIQVANGRSVRLSDLAEVRDAYAEQRSLAKLNGHQVLDFSISKAKGFSDVTLYEDAKKEIAKLEKEGGGKIKFHELYTSVTYTKGQYKAAIHAIIEGAVLAVVVVFIFLRDRRATFISALAIPLSAIPTFWIMDLMGFTLNGISLLALSLVAGVLVDDAIVEIENIVRHMRMGKSAFQASIDAADEIGLAVVATTFAIVAVFLPVGLMPGVSGQFFKNFGITIVVAVLMSLAVARLITPMIAAYMLKSHGAESHGEGKWMDYYMAALTWTLNRVPHRRWYRLFIRDNRKLTMVFGFLCFLATILAFATLPFTFQPELDLGISQVRIQMVPGTTLQQTEGVADRTAAILRSDPNVEIAIESINVGNANIFIKLKEKRERTTTEFERNLAPQLRAIADARVTFQSQAGGGGGRDITVMLAGDDPVKLYQAADQAVAAMKKIPEIRAPRVDGDLPRPEIVIKPRFDLAADLGVTTQALSQTIRIATLGDIDQNVAKFSLSDRQIPIRVALAENSRRSLDTVKDLPVPTSFGGSVPLRVVAEVGFGSGPSQIRRYNQARRLMIGADIAPGAIQGDVQSRVFALDAFKNLPSGVQRVAFGNAKWQAEMVTNFVIAVITGVFMVFAVLVLLYKRVIPPFVNMASLVLAPLGGALALHIVGMPISMPVMIGLLMLLGIVAKNSILLIDFAIEELGRGVPPRQAILEAGHKRAQPIVMTTVAMIAGMMPVALALGSDGSFNQPMAVTVIGGLILSTLLTLLIVPAGFSLADGIERKIGPKLGRLLGGEGGSKGHPVAPVQPAE
ncbi:efflux RND transporter permease subunit [Sphingomonas sp. BIUV-7]|uniref:Efflux RND transporter permease subunit n=1 Tax=Sphingomonas natans TaxID=3063330 RepID=A0ABT8Y634_9SPHN|nr:efflux RND transporter permease subunit [Sphingomonas sp. BIUV-7]MDO6413130.1 efflux RND transporter permease subunit [Sphingomonas sp. BIUV-7]